MLGNRTSQQWIAQYSSSHQHPINRICHTLGIPTILVSVAVLLASLFLHRLWPYALGLFVIGWILQFIGHAFEGKAPEFFHDWRFLFVGVRWWWAKINAKAGCPISRVLCEKWGVWGRRQTPLSLRPLRILFYAGITSGF